MKTRTTTIYRTDNAEVPQGATEIASGVYLVTKREAHPGYEELLTLIAHDGHKESPGVFVEKFLIEIVERYLCVPIPC